MKIKRTETHDRLLQFKQQADYLSQGCQDCIRNRPKEFENYPFYIFAHKREIEIDERISLFQQDLHASLSNLHYQRQYLTLEEVPSARMIWAPRLTKPLAQENSMLFKAYPPTDHIKVIWILPSKELWGQYKKGNMTEHQIVCESIHLFQSDREKLEAKEPDDLSEEKIKSILIQIKKNKENEMQSEGHANSLGGVSSSF